MGVRRVRGALLRLARRRPLAMIVGGILMASAAWLEFGGRFSESWVGGLGLVLGATGAALFWTGVVGVRPDWIDD